MHVCYYVGWVRYVYETVCLSDRILTEYESSFRSALYRIPEEGEATDGDTPQVRIQYYVGWGQIMGARVSNVFVTGLTCWEPEWTQNFLFLELKLAAVDVTGDRSRCFTAELNM